jgi:hypothetical protein
MANQFRQFGKWPQGTNMQEIAKEYLPRDFWHSFCCLRRNETKIIELTDELFLELIKKGNNISAYLKLKMIGCESLIIVKWQE